MSNMQTKPIPIEENPLMSFPLGLNCSNKSRSDDEEVIGQNVPVTHQRQGPFGKDWIPLLTITLTSQEHRTPFRLQHLRLLSPDESFETA